MINETTRNPLILVVDDTEANRYGVIRVLRRAGFETIEAANGFEGLEQARAHLPDLVVLDIRLPDLDGYEVCRRLKADPATESILVLNLSASFVDRMDRVHGLESGADGYLVQPVHPDELVATVQALLRTRVAEERARELATHWQKTFDVIGDAIGLIDPNLHLIRCNQALADFLNAPPAELIGRACADLFDGVFDEHHMAEFCEMLNPGKRIVATLTSGDHWFHLKSDPIWRSDHELDGAVLVLSDITELKQSETRLKEQALRLAEADRRKDEFLAMLAHELRNPLSPIRNAVHILRALAPTKSPIERQANVIERQVSHMARLLDDLLDASRVTRGKIELRRERLVLAKVLSHAIETAMPLISRRHHSLHSTVPSPNLMVEGDLDRLAQVVGNLLTNAAKYTEEGGQIWIKATFEDEGWAVISVRDTGVGIEQEMLPRVFDLFAQADQSLDRSQGGLGIGLTMVRELVKLHHGTAYAESEGPGKGSCFIVRLPAWLEQTAPELPEPICPAEREDRTTGCRVLIVDDVVDAATSLAEVLDLWGYKTHTAHDGFGAFAAAQHFRPEIVLLDIGLPGLSGFEVARRLRELPESAETLLIALTGYGQESDRMESHAAGFDAHLVKPVDLDQLRNLLTRARA